MNKYRQHAIITAISIALMLCPFEAAAQVAVSLSPVPHIQFLNNSGIPLAAGCIFTYAAGTTTPAATYVDSTGTGQNTNPIILNAGGFADIWLPNAAFKFKVVSAGGVACASGSTQWTVDNISGVLGLLNLVNTWTAANTFSQPVTITPNANQLVLGTPGFQTTVNFPAPAGNVTINAPNVTGTLARTSGDTFTSPTLNNPVLNNPNINGTIVTGPPATYLVMTNDLLTGTTLNKLAKINPAGLAGFAILPLITDTGGITGIVVSGAGIGGNATIQQSGSASCVFDNAVTSGDYVQISTTIAGDCHDSGIAAPSYPTTGGQIIGRLLATNASPGTYLVDLFGPEIRIASGAGLGCTNSTPVTVSNTVAQTSLLSCAIPANSLNAGSLLAVDLVGIESTASAFNLTLTASVGGGTTCSNSPALTGIANNEPIYFWVKFGVLTAGGGGTANMTCGYSSNAAFGGGTLNVSGTVGNPTISVNTTISNTLLIQVTMSVANAGNSVTGQLLKAVLF